jgi:hypothetical protein
MIAGIGNGQRIADRTVGKAHPTRLISEVKTLCNVRNNVPDIKSMVRNNVPKNVSKNVSFDIIRYLPVTRQKRKVAHQEGRREK